MLWQVYSTEPKIFFASRIADDKLHPQTQGRHCCLPAIVKALLFKSSC